MIDQFATRLLVICVLTDDCNQTCKYCSENAGLGNTKMLPYEMVDNLLKDIYEVSKEAIISFIGGEVTIWPRFYELLGEENFKKFQYKSLYTNATALSEKNVLDIKAANFFEVRVSVDSDRKQEHDAFRGKGTFDKAVSYINMMPQNDIPVTVGTVLQKSNLSRLDSLINFLKKLDVKMIHFFPLYLKGRGKSQMKLGIDETDRLIIKNKLENDYKNNHCSRTPFCINGTAYFKVLNTGECVIQKGREKLVLGSLYESSFADLYRKAVEMLKPEIVSCKNCKYYDDPMLCENMHIYCMDDLNFR